MKAIGSSHVKIIFRTSFFLCQTILVENDIYEKGKAKERSKLTAAYDAVLKAQGYKRVAEITIDLLYVHESIL